MVFFSFPQEINTKIWLFLGVMTEMLRSFSWFLVRYKYLLAMAHD